MIIVMRYPGGKSKAITLSYDDGVIQDVRLMKIMDKHGLKGTFNINSGLFPKEDAKDKGKMSRKQVLDLYTNSGHEVAVHGSMHPHYEEMYPPLVTDDVMKDRKELERMFGKIIRGMAYPFGTYNDDVVNCLKACGIAYSRTVESTEWFDIPTDWLRMPATCHHNNPKIMELADRFIEGNRRPGDPCWLFYLWGHSYEFDNDDNWNVIEEFAQKTGNREDIWYATNIEIYDYVQAYKQLQYNIDLTKVYNPTQIDLWISHTDIGVIEIKAGETVEL